MINFAKVEQRVKQLKRQVAAGEITREAFEAQLMELIDAAPDGYYWMFGHETETWYRHNGEQWVPKEPGKLRMLTPREDSSRDGRNPGAQAPAPQAEALNWGWFAASLVVLGLIGWIVYVSV